MMCKDCPFWNGEECFFDEWLWRHQSDATAPCQEEEDE